MSMSDKFRKIRGQGMMFFRQINGQGRQSIFLILESKGPLEIKDLNLEEEA